MLTYWRTRVTLATQTAVYAAVTLLLLGVVELEALLSDHRSWAIAAMMLPLIVCPPVTYLITRRIVRRRAAALVEIYRRLERGDVEPWPLTDLEFQSSREIFMNIARELFDTRRALEDRDRERRRLFSDVVHEIGTPVSSLLGLADALEMPALVATPEQRAKVAGAIAKESERLAGFVEDLRDIARLDDPSMVLELGDVDLADLARGVVERTQALPDAPPIDLDAAEPVHLRADGARLEQVAVNLVNNAVRHGRGAKVRVCVRAEGERVRLSVEDAGAGVAEADLVKLGRRFGRLEPSRTRDTGGTGLGLAIVAAIVERHGGGVKFERSELGGLAVHITFPRHDRKVDR